MKIRGIYIMKNKRNRLLIEEMAVNRQFQRGRRIVEDCVFLWEIVLGLTLLGLLQLLFRYYFVPHMYSVQDSVLRVWLGFFGLIVFLVTIQFRAKKGICAKVGLFMLLAGILRLILWLPELTLSTIITGGTLAILGALVLLLPSAQEYLKRYCEIIDRANTKVSTIEMLPDLESGDPSLEKSFEITPFVKRRFFFWRMIACAVIVFFILDLLDLLAVNSFMKYLFTFVGSLSALVMTLALLVGLNKGVRKTQEDEVLLMANKEYAMGTLRFCALAVLVAGFYFYMYIVL